MNKLVSVSFLITAEDYRGVKVEIRKSRVSQKEKNAAALSGLLILVFGLIGALFMTRISLDYLLWGMVMLGGVFIATFPLFIAPLIAGAKAEKEYLQIKNRLSATVIEIFEEEIHIKTNEYEGNFPYDKIFGVKKTENFFIIEGAVGEYRILPLRLLSDAEILKLREFFGDTLKEKYVEGM